MYTHKTPEGFTITVYCSAYVDWGLLIESPEGESVFNHPCYLAAETYGSDDEGNEWSDQQWQDCITNEADQWLEECLPDDSL